MAISYKTYMQGYTPNYSEVFATPTISAGTLTIDMAAAHYFMVSLNANVTTLTISNVVASAVNSFVLEFTADGTPRTVTWPASFEWPGGTAPTITSTSGKRDIYTCYTSDNGTTWAAFVTGQNI